MEHESFNDSFRRRTKAFAISIIKFIGSLNKNDEVRILLRSSTQWQPILGRHVVQDHKLNILPNYALFRRSG